MRVLLVGGGTAGHLAPGFAVAEALAERGVGWRFAVPAGGREAAFFPRGWPAPLALPAPRTPRTRRGLVAFAPRLLAATVRSVGAVRREAPDLVLALGGWPCVPAALAARVGGIPLALLASDALPGRAVRLLAPLARRIYLARASAATALGGHGGVRVVGPALRRSIRTARGDRARFGLAEDLPLLVVVGGSLGARGLDEAVLAGLEAAAADGDLAARLQVLHVVGRSGVDAARRYRALGIRHHVAPWIEAMGEAWRSADLAVTRAGAVTCAELRATGTPAVLVPYPHHADRQQFANAAPLVAAGGAVLVEEADLDPGRFAAEVLARLGDAEALAAMAEAMRSTQPDGSVQIADDIVRSLGEGGRRGSP